jgi:hypothetical protein
LDGTRSRQDQGGDKCKKIRALATKKAYPPEKINTKFAWHTATI